MDITRHKQGFWGTAGHRDPSVSAPPPDERHQLPHRPTPLPLSASPGVRQGDLLRRLQTLGKKASFAEAVQAHGSIEAPAKSTRLPEQRKAISDHSNGVGRRGPAGFHQLYLNNSNKLEEPENPVLPTEDPNGKIQAKISSPFTREEEDALFRTETESLRSWIRQRELQYMQGTAKPQDAAAAFPSAAINKLNYPFPPSDTGLAKSALPVRNSADPLSMAPNTSQQVHELLQRLGGKSSDACEDVRKSQQNGPEDDPVIAAKTLKGSKSHGKQDEIEALRIENARLRQMVVKLSVQLNSTSSVVTSNSYDSWSDAEAAEAHFVQHLTATMSDALKELQPATMAAIRATAAAHNRPGSFALRPPGPKDGTKAIMPSPARIPPSGGRGRSKKLPLKRAGESRKSDSVPQASRRRLNESGAAINKANKQGGDSADPELSPGIEASVSTYQNGKNINGLKALSAAAAIAEEEKMEEVDDASSEAYRLHMMATSMQAGGPHQSAPGTQAQKGLPVATKAVRKALDQTKETALEMQPPSITKKEVPRPREEFDNASRDIGQDAEAMQAEQEREANEVYIDKPDVQEEETLVEEQDQPQGREEPGMHGAGRPEDNMEDRGYEEEEILVEEEEEEEEVLVQEDDEETEDEDWRLQVSETAHQRQQAAEDTLQETAEVADDEARFGVKPGADRLANSSKAYEQSEADCDGRYASLRERSKKKRRTRNLNSL